MAISSARTGGHLAGQLEHLAGDPDGVVAGTLAQLFPGDAVGERAQDGAAEITAGPLDVGFVGTAVGVAG
jgi:hypothetical protein